MTKSVSASYDIKSYDADFVQFGIDFFIKYDIIVSRYNDIIYAIRECGLLSNRTKQVQFRMPDELHTELKAALAYDRSSFADFFNKAAEDYLSNRKADTQKKSKSKNGGNKNG